MKLYFNQPFKHNIPSKLTGYSLFICKQLSSAFILPNLAGYMSQFLNLYNSFPIASFFRRMSLIKMNDIQILRHIKSVRAAISVYFVATVVRCKSNQGIMFFPVISDKLG